MAYSPLIANSLPQIAGPSLMAAGKIGLGFCGQDGDFAPHARVGL
jgi:hypothetical protein